MFQKSQTPSQWGAGEREVSVLSHPPFPIREKRLGGAAGVTPAALKVAPCDCGKGRPCSKIVSVNRDLDFSNSVINASTGFQFHNQFIYRKLIHRTLKCPVDLDPL